MSAHAWYHTEAFIGASPRPKSPTLITPHAHPTRPSYMSPKRQYDTAISLKYLAKRLAVISYDNKKMQKTYYSLEKTANDYLAAIDTKRNVSTSSVLSLQERIVSITSQDLWNRFMSVG